MKTTKFFDRIKEIKILVTTDTGEILEQIITHVDIMKVPGINSIQTPETVLGGLITKPIEKWLEKNFIKSQLFLDIESKIVKISNYTSVGDNTIELYNVNTFDKKIYKYSSYGDAYNDLVLCKKHFLN